ncbi:MAG TPA: hypothetical protein VFP84_03595 [Kofleriaceae bacterium]|nr:hypothetical protein [Kofleriaceae bacterium]
MRSFFAAVALAGLAACGATRTVIVWENQGNGESTRTAIENNGGGQYTATADGVQHDDEQLSFTKGQIHELAELYRNRRVCEMSHDPAYTPVANEGQTTLVLDLEDLHCSVTLYDLEWEKKAKDITETMRSMRPLNTHHKPYQRKLDPRGMTQ